jgi:glutamate synthase domain-containing protein 3
VLFIVDEGNLQGQLHADVLRFPVGDEHEGLLKGLLVEHAALTGSARASRLLADWEAMRFRFARVVPRALPAKTSDELVPTAPPPSPPAALAQVASRG